MSRKTLGTTTRGTAGLTAAAVAATAFGALFLGTSNAVAVGPVVTITSATVANPVPTKAAPTIPAAGPQDGSGTAVSIVGTNFPANPKVLFGTGEAASTLRVSDTLLLAKPRPIQSVPADIPLRITVVDESTDETKSADAALEEGYVYKAAPVLTDAKYSSDFKTLEITGTHLTDTRSLQLGPLALKPKSTDVTATSIKVKIPGALLKAKYAISATTDWGTGTLSDSWNVRPVAGALLDATTGKAVKGADSIAPDTFLRLTGTALSGVTKVAFGAAEATFLVSSDKELFVKVPPMAFTEIVKNNVATVNVVVTSADLVAAKPLKFTYGVKPIVNAVDKTEAATGSVVTVTGENLSGVKLYFGSEKGAKALSPKSGSTATSAQYVMPTKAATGFVLDQAYTLWFVSKGGNLQTDRTLKVLSGPATVTPTTEPTPSPETPAGP